MNPTRLTQYVRIQIPAALRRFTDQQREIELEAATVGEALQALAARYPALSSHLFTPDGSLRAFVNVYVEDTNIRQLEGLDTPVKEGTRLILVPSIAGGHQ